MCLYLEVPSLQIRPPLPFFAYNTTCQYIVLRTVWNVACFLTERVATNCSSFVQFYAIHKGMYNSFLHNFAELAQRIHLFIRRSDLPVRGKGWSCNASEVISVINFTVLLKAVPPNIFLYLLFRWNRNNYVVLSFVVF